MTAKSVASSITSQPPKSYRFSAIQTPPPRQAPSLGGIFLALLETRKVGGITTHGPSKNPRPSQWPVSHRGSRRVGRTGRRQRPPVRSRRQACLFSLSLRGIGQQAILRRHPQPHRIPRRGISGQESRRLEFWDWDEDDRPNRPRTRNESEHHAPRLPQRRGRRCWCSPDAVASFRRRRSPEVTRLLSARPHRIARQPSRIF